MSWIEALIKLSEPVPPEPPTPTTNIYGAYWDGTSTTSWTRTDDASDFGAPNPYYSGMSSTPSSPFDNIMPWSGMQKVEDADAGTLVSIPKFYYKITQDASTHDMKIQIANSQVEGFSISPAHMDRGDGQGERDVVYVGRYHCATSTYKSTSGVAPMGGVTRANSRTAIHNLGSTIWQWDFAIRFTIWLLYLVEFANWNSQLRIGYGCGDNSSANMGYTDSMPYHTGTMQSSRTSYGLGTQYRHIEGLWDNAFDWIDGCYYNSSGLNIILDPTNFSDSSGGIAVGIPTIGYPSQFTLKEVNGTYPLFIPTESSGSNTTFSCDYWDFNASNPCLYVGGYFKNLSLGLFYVNWTTGTGVVDYRGSRIMKLPNNEIEIKPFATATDAELASIINGYYNGDITLSQIQEVWSVGDKRSIHINAMSATGVSESHHADDYDYVILDFDHDTLTTPINGVTKALITVQQDRIFYKNTTDASYSSFFPSVADEGGYMNDSSTNVGGWTSCARRTWCNSVFYNAVESGIKSLIKPVVKLTSAGNKSSVINSDNDNVFLLSEIEVFGTVTESKEGEGSQYSYFTTGSNRYKKPSYESYASARWWERSPCGSSVNAFSCVNLGGTTISNDANVTQGLAPAFCL